MGYYTGVLFNSVDLTALDYVFIHNVITENQADVDLYNAKIARADGIKHYGKSYGSKKVTIQGHIGANSRELFMSARSTLFKTLETQEATLRVPIKNLPIEYTATVENIVIKDSAGGYGEFEVTFLCSDPFGYDRDLRTLINGTLATTATQEITYLEAIGGDYKTPLTITATLADLTGGTAKYLTFTNTAGDYITITRTWTVGDVLVIDMKNKTCKVNGANVDYTGYFWETGVGDLSFIYADSLTTRSVGILATYKRRYL